MGKREKLSVQAFIGVFRRLGMPIQNDNTVVQVPLSMLKSTPLTFFFKEGCKNYVKIPLFGGSL